MKWLEVKNESEKVAKIKIHGVIGGGWFDEGVTAEQVDADLEEIKSLKAETIEVDLDSGGGSVLHGIKIHNLLKENSAKIKIRGTGIVASIATVIAAAADEDQFTMADNAFYLIHEGRMGTGGTVGQINRDIDVLSKINDTIANIYSSEFNITKEEALAIMSINDGEGEFLTASEANERGYVDSIYKPSKGATASITQKELTKYKIKANININQKNMKFNLKEIKAIVVDAYKAFIGASTDEEKKAENFNESAVEKSTEAIVESLQEQVDAFKEEKENEVTEANAKVTELEAKIVELEASKSEPKGDDANLGDTKKPTQADAALAEFVNQIPEGRKIAMAHEAKKNEEKK